MAEQKWVAVAVVGGKVVGTFDTKEEADKYERNENGRDNLNKMIDACSSYEGIDTGLVINYFKTDETAQSIVDYLQYLVGEA